MAVSNIKANFQCDIQKVWDVVTSIHNYSWRSDLSKIEISGKNQFIEYTKDGLHLSDEGYEVVTEEIKEYLK